MGSFLTRDEAISHYIIVPLGEHVKDFNVNAIADSILDFDTSCGYYSNILSHEFWEIVSDNEL